MVNAHHPAAPQQRRTVTLGVIGGSGLYQTPQLQDAEQVRLTTPFGDPSDAYTVGRIVRENGSAVQVVFLPRHGVGHRFTPSEINYRANVHGLKQLGVTHLLSVSAVGSLQEDIEPGHVVFVDQFIDRTKNRASSFFGEGVVGHVSFGDPTDANLTELGVAAARAAGATVHAGGTCIVMEGPAFSTRAESNLYRSWGASVIGMTAMPEAKLAREAELGYCLLALSTDYDCWHLDEVSVEAVVAVLRKNVALARDIVVRLAKALPEATDTLPVPDAVRNAIITAPEAIDAAARERLDLIAGHYFDED